MKKIIILTSRFLSFVDFSEIKKHFPETRFSLIADSSLLNSPDLKKKWDLVIDNIHIVSCQKIQDNDPLPLYNFSETKNIVELEIQGYLNEEVRLICLDEGNLLLAAQLRDVLNIPGARPDDILPFRDKLVMKDRLIKDNIRVPTCALFCKDRMLKESNTYYNEIKKRIKTPFVLKPKSHASSFGIHIIHDEKDFYKATQIINSLNLVYEVEEFIVGDLYHCDVLVNNDGFPFLECTQYSCPNLNFLSGENIIGLPLLHTCTKYKNMASFTKTCLRCMGAKSGVYHLELFSTKEEELIFLEVAARSPGALATVMYKKANGVNLVQSDFLMQSGLQISVESSFNTHCLYGIISLEIGRVKECIEPDIESEYDIQWRIKKGDICSQPRSLSDNACLLVAWNDDYSVLKKDFERLKAYKPLLTDRHQR